jgi:TonB family protein
MGVHALAFVAAGHSRAAAGKIATETAAVVAPEELSALTIEAEAQEPVAKTPASAPRPPSHTHSYPVPPDHDAIPHDPSLVHLPGALAAPRPVPSPMSLGPAPEVVHAAGAPEPARFTMSIGHAATPDESAAAAQAVEGAEEGSEAAPFSEGQVSSPARFLGAFSPAYPPVARAQEIEADVVVEFVVTRAGTVVGARILKHAGFGFDESVLSAARAARFSPARHDGRPVAVRVRKSVSFRLR